MRLTIVDIDSEMRTKLLQLLKEQINKVLTRINEAPDDE